MKLFFPKEHYDKNYRGQVFPLLKPFLKNEGFTDAERISLYGISERDYEFSGTMEAADVVLLTMSWNYYVKTRQEKLALELIQKAENLNKKVVIVNTGDFGLRLPRFSKVIVLRSSGYKAKLKGNEFIIPPFINDPLKKYYHSDIVLPRPYTPKPVVGFCGLATGSIIKAIKGIGNTKLHNFKFYTGISKEEPQELMSTSYLRARVLGKLTKSPLIEDNFILREKYRAGVTEGKDNHTTTLEFYNNIKDSDYVVCVRGAGNFSVRFYETLAMGRIPVYINTDGILPLEEIIQWKKHVVWVEQEDLSRVAEKIKAFHGALSPSEFFDLQLANRKLWEERLYLPSFFKSFFTLPMQKNIG